MEKNDTMPDSKKRFTDRVADYVKYRPNYPVAIIEFMKNKGMTQSSVFADVGSGTGLLTKLFLENGNKVYGVEPNKKMREAGETYLSNFNNFVSITGSSEETSLPNSSVDFITAGQAYHWFSQEPTKKEFKRILKKSNHYNVFLIWNERTDTTSFNRDLEQFIRKFSNDYLQVSHSQDEKKKQNLFFNEEFSKESFANKQVLSFEALKGRLLSSSYMLQKSDPRYQQFENELQALFDKHKKDNVVELLYRTEVYYGKL